MSKTTEDVLLAGTTWRFEVSPGGAGWTDFRAWPNSGQEADGTLLFGDMTNLTTDHTQITPEITGYVKFDGCSQFNVDTHCCGANSARSLAEAIQWCHRLCLRMPYVDACADYSPAEMAGAKMGPKP